MVVSNSDVYKTTQLFSAVTRIKLILICNRLADIVGLPSNIYIFKVSFITMVKLQVTIILVSTPTEGNFCCAVLLQHLLVR